VSHAQSSASFGAAPKNGRYRTQGERDLDDLFYYFYHIEEYADAPETFGRQWKRIKQFPFDTKELSNILYKAAKHIEASEEFEPQRAAALKKVISDNWESWQSGALRQISKFQPINLTLTLKAHQLLGFRPSKEFSAAWKNRANELVGIYTARDFVSQTISAAHLAIILPPTVRARLLAKAEEDPEFLGNEHKTDLQWASAVNHSIWKRAHDLKIGRIAHDLIDSAPANSAIEKMRYDADLYFGWDSGAQNPIRQETTSPFERQYISVLKEAGINVRKEQRRIPGLPQAIDFTARATLDIEHEIDGPQHSTQVAGAEMSINPISRGPDFLRAANMRKLEPNMRILHVPHTLASLVVDGKEARYRLPSDHRKALASLFVKKAEGLEPGVYRAFHFTNNPKRPFGVVPFMPKLPSGR